MGDDKKRGTPPRPRVPRRKIPTLSDVPVAPDEDTDPRDFTPIHDFSELGPAVSEIRSDMRKLSGVPQVVEGLERTLREEVKPKLDAVNDRGVDLDARQRSSEARIKVLERDSKEMAAATHPCNHEEDFREIGEDGRQIRFEVQNIVSRVAVAETKVQVSERELKKSDDRTDKRWGRVTAALVTIGIFALAGIGGWLVTLVTVRADVRHLSGEQTKLREQVTKGTSSATSNATRVEEAATRVEEATATPPVVIAPDPLEALWCDLSDREKSRQKRRRDGKIPTKRCP